MITFEAFHTVPIVALRDMDPYMFIGGDGKDFPVPGEDYHFVRLDLSRALIKNPAGTFFIQLTEDSMVEEGLLPGDILIVDRTMEPRSGMKIIAYLEGEFTVRRLHFTEEGITLTAANSDFPPVDVEPDMEFDIWGVIRDVLPQKEGEG